MVERLHILQINTADKHGGAAELVQNLFETYRLRGHSSWLAVGHKNTEDPNILFLPHDQYRNQWARFWISAAECFPVSHPFRYQLPWLGQIKRILKIQQGHEDFDFPATQRILNLTSKPPDIVHCHNLHGGYFDLRFLSELSRQVPVILSLHDAWLLSGHCAHSFDCDRWKIGCGACPDLESYPAVRRDATHFNWRRKKEIYKKSRLYVTTACHWLMQKVEESMLAPAVLESRVIPYGVDLSIFHPVDKRIAREKLKISQECKLLLFVGHGVRKNIWKDYETINTAVRQVGRRFIGERIVFIALGEEAPTETINQIEIRFIPSKQSREVLAGYYQAADIYLHAAHVDTFPLTTLEALACGTPVIATAVGGIPEQVKRLDQGHENGHATGMLVPPSNAAEMAKAIEFLLKNDSLRLQMSKNAVEDAKKRFDLNRQVDDYLAWYQELMEASCESSRQ